MESSFWPSAWPGVGGRLGLGRSRLPDPLFPLLPCISIPAPFWQPRQLLRERHCPQDECPCVLPQPTCGHVLTALTTQLSSISTFRGSGAQPTCGVPRAGAPGGSNGVHLLPRSGWGGRQRPLPQSHRTVGGTALSSLPRVLGQHGHPRPGTSREGARGKSAAGTRPPGHYETAGGKAHHLTTFSWSQASPL